MNFTRSIALLFVLAPLGVRPAGAVDYFWQTTAGGSFAQAANWLPAALRPGGAADTVNFDLGVAAASRYQVTGVGGQNNRLLVHADTVQLAVTDYTLTSAGSANPGFVAGVASGDVGNVLLSGPAASVLRTDASSIGRVNGSSGVVTVDGLQWIGTGNLRVGDAGVGTLMVRNGADVTQASSTLGNLAGSGGTATVIGNGSTWTSTGELIVARMGNGVLLIQSGGDVTSGTGTIGAESGVTGTVLVDGSGTSWTNNGALTVGGAGDGTLLVQTGGVVTSANGFVGRLAGGEGTANISGLGASWNVSGRMSLGGDVLTGVAGGAGTLNVEASAAVTVATDVTLFPVGQLRLAGGTLSAGEIRFQSAGGQFNWTSGTLQLGAYRGNLTNAAGLLETRGLISTITVDGNYTQQAGGTLKLGVGGPTPNTSYDVVNVGGTASLDGLLAIEQVAGFVPQPNMTFNVLDAAAIMGAFDNVASGQRLTVTGGTAGGTFVVNYGAGSPFDPTRVVLSSFQITGDYNLDGIVGAADYTIWRNTLGSTTDLRANGNNAGASAGVIDAADFAAWKSNFGKKATGLGAGSLDAAAVPEPGMGALAVLAFMLLGCGRKTAANFLCWCWFVGEARPSAKFLALECKIGPPAANSGLRPVF